MLFVDTGAWFSLSVPTDRDHERAKDYIDKIDLTLVTTDFVVDELLTLFIFRRQKHKGLEWLRDVLGGGYVELVRITPDDFSAACEIYRQFSDKKWSFTDCTSYVVMRRLQVIRAFSFDAHFHEFGFVEVVP